MLPRTLRSISRLPDVLAFGWSATRGYRLRPWRSPYLRWRMETYSGQHAEAVTIRSMLALLWRERRQFVRFLGWVGDLGQKRRSHG